MPVAILYYTIVFIHTFFFFFKDKPLLSKCQYFKAMQIYYDRP